VPLTIIVWRDPDLSPKVRELLRSWALDKLVASGRLQGSVRRPNGALELVQEGRIGYEQYAAQALVLLGIDVEDALRWDLTTAITKASGQAIPYDTRLPENNAGTHSIYLAQQSRARELGKLVAVSEDNLDRPPYFVYNSVYNGRTPWAAFTPDGKDASAHRGLSIKAAYGWSLLYDDEYAGRLRAGISKAFDPQRGWYSGIYDADGKLNRAITANTNGIILEALWYQTRGPLIRAGQRQQ
jgi:antitoxin component of RelBE/YafQ-DinJ toxin-antitoxin module